MRRTGHLLCDGQPLVERRWGPREARRLQDARVVLQEKGDFEDAQRVELPVHPELLVRGIWDQAERLRNRSERYAEVVVRDQRRGELRRTLHDVGVDMARLRL